MTTHYRNCHLCEAMCGVAIEVDGDQVVSVKGDEHDTFSRGHICPKGAALGELHHDPDRLKTPLKRVGDRFEPIAWDVAFEEIAERLVAIQKNHGKDAVASYIGNPAVHNHGSALSVPMLTGAIGSKQRYSATSCDQLPHQLAAFLMFGHQLLMPLPDLERTKYMLMLGANPMASNGSLMTAPDFKERLKELRQRGGKLVVVDPRKTETAKLADEHVFIRPGSDALFLLALTNVVLSFGPRLRALASMVKRLDVLVEATNDFTPERVAGATGIPAATIRRLAKELFDADPAVVYGRMGASTQAFGGLCQWLVPALNIITGNFDRPGGAMWTRPAVDVLSGSRLVGIGVGSIGRWKSRVRGLPEVGGELPAVTLAEEMLTPGPGQIRALVTVAGNPALSVPNGKQMEKALSGLELLVCVDPYLNETSRLAHYVLPAVSPLARSQYDAALSLFAIRNVAKWSPPIFTPPADGRDDWQIILGLIERIQAKKPTKLAKRVTAAVWRRLGPDGAIDLMLQAGPYGRFRGGLSLKKLKRHPHGVDLGPLEPQLPRKLGQRKHIDVAPAEFVNDLSRIRALLDVVPEGLLLIGRRHLRSNNSWMHNQPKLASGKPRCTLLVHPDDAKKLGLDDGRLAKIVSRVGAVLAPVEVSDEMMPGVVSLPHGFGHAVTGTQLSVASRPSHAGVSANELTDERDVDVLTGTAVFNGVPVTVFAA